MNRFLLAAWFVFATWEAAATGAMLLRSRREESVDPAPNCVFTADDGHTIRFEHCRCLMIDAGQGDLFEIDGKTLSQLADEGRAVRQPDGAIVYSYFDDPAKAQR